MKPFLRLASFIFHPLWMPFLGSLFFFILTPKFYSASVMKANLLIIFILTIFIPFIFFYILKTTGIVQTLRLDSSKERRLPLLFFCVISSLVFNFVLNQFYYAELYYFFAGILLSVLICFIFSFVKIKISLHVLGITSLCIFLVQLSLFYQSNMVVLIALLFFCIGWTASSRLQTKEHTDWEVLLGLVIGIFSQVIFTQFWS